MAPLPERIAPYVLDLIEASERGDLKASRIIVTYEEGRLEIPNFSKLIECERLFGEWLKERRASPHAGPASAI
jgi:hypothetical protein